jgi:hypothetical protein
LGSREKKREQYSINNFKTHYICAGRVYRDMNLQMLNNWGREGKGKGE